MAWQMHSASATQAGCTALQRFRNAVASLRNTSLLGAAVREAASPRLAPAGSAAGARSASHSPHPLWRGSLATFPRPLPRAC